jgi:hypothetical protein
MATEHLMMKLKFRKIFHIPQGDEEIIQYKISITTKTALWPNDSSVFLFLL